MAKSKRAQVRIIKEQQPIEKADTSVQLTQEEAFNAGDWIMPPNGFWNWTVAKVFLGRAITRLGWIRKKNVLKLKSVRKTLV